MIDQDAVISSALENERDQDDNVPLFERDQLDIVDIDPDDDSDDDENINAINADY